MAQGVFNKHISYISPNQALGKNLDKKDRHQEKDISYRHQEKW